MDDEGKWDKDRQHLDDHEHDLWLEEALLTCEHEDYTITNIENVRTHDLRGQKMKHPVVEVELTCDFCDKTNYGDIRLASVLELLNVCEKTDTQHIFWLGIHEQEWS